MSVFSQFEESFEDGSPGGVWAGVRADYLAGDEAAVVCARHQVSRSQLYARARREGWLRRDRSAEADAAEREEEDQAFVLVALDSPPVPAEALYRRAWARAERAILTGRRVEAQGWVRLARQLKAMAAQEADVAAWRRAQEEAAAARDRTSASPPRPGSPPAPIPDQPPQAVGDVPRRVGCAPATSTGEAEGGGKVERGRDFPDFPDSVFASPVPAAPAGLRRHPPDAGRPAGAGPAQ